MAVVLVTGASSGFGAITSRALADAGHVVYAGVRDTASRNQSAVADAKEHASSNGVALRVVELDVSDQSLVDTAVRDVLPEAGGLDIVVHNAGHMVLGPAESFTPEQLADLRRQRAVDPARQPCRASPHARAR